MTIEIEAKTEWFPYQIKPIYKGVYETNLFQDVGFAYYSYWNGIEWGNEFSSIFNANQNRRIGMQNKPWRGLLEKAK